MHDHRHQLRKLFHGPVLGDIAEQVEVRQDDGSTRRYCRHTWKTWFKDKFNGGYPTEEMSDAEFHKFILAVQAFAASEMGVTFTEKLT